MPELTERCENKDELVTFTHCEYDELEPANETNDGMVKLYCNTSW